MSPQWSCSGCLFRWDAGQDLTSHTLCSGKRSWDFAETLSSSTSVLRSQAHDKRLLPVWGAGGDKYFWTMESALCLPLESGQCQCCLSSAQLWSRHIHPWRTTLGGRRWPDLNSPISLLRGGVLPMELPCDCLGWAWLFPWQHSLCDLLRWERGTRATDT